MDWLYIIFSTLLGLLVGSFTNVLIWRLPRGESVSFPPSHCVHCNHPLAPKDLFPLFSWLYLRGKCRYCKGPIKARYPIVEAISGFAYGSIALAFPIEVYGFTALGLMLFFTILIASSAIDLDTYTIPDELTIVGTFLGIGFSLLASQTILLPNSFLKALFGAMIGAGVLVALDLFGSWILRRFSERKYPEFPIGYQQIALSLAVGSFAGVWIGILFGVISAIINFFKKSVLRIPEFITLPVALIFMIIGVMEENPIKNTFNSLLAAGGTSLLAGIYWWFFYMKEKKQEKARNNNETESETKEEKEQQEQQFDFSAMGFGDVKLAAAIGAFLGINNVLLSIILAVFSGAIFGIIQIILKAEKRVKFGPYLAFGAIITTFWGNKIIEFYKNML